MAETEYNPRENERNRCFERVLSAESAGYWLDLYSLYERKGRNDIKEKLEAIQETKNDYFAGNTSESLDKLKSTLLVQTDPDNHDPKATWRTLMRLYVAWSRVDDDLKNIDQTIEHLTGMQEIRKTRLAKAAQLSAETEQLPPVELGKHQHWYRAAEERLESNLHDIAIALQNEAPKTDSDREAFVKKYLSTSLKHRLPRFNYNGDKQVNTLLQAELPRIRSRLQQAITNKQYAQAQRLADTIARMELSLDISPKRKETADNNNLEAWLEIARLRFSDKMNMLTLALAYNNGEDLPLWKNYMETIRDNWHWDNAFLTERGIPKNEKERRELAITKGLPLQLNLAIGRKKFTEAQELADMIAEGRLMLKYIKNLDAIVRKVGRMR